MVNYTIYCIHGAKCLQCKRWIPRLFSKKPEFQQGKKCEKCYREYSPKELVNECGGRIDIIEFDSDKLYLKIMKSYEGKRPKADAQETALRVVQREKLRFEQKYGFEQPVQKRLE